MMTESLSLTWDLDQIFPGGSHSPAFAQYLDALEQGIARFRDAVAAADIPTSGAEALKWSRLIEQAQELTRLNREAGAFVTCLTAQNVKDQQAKLVGGRVTQISAALQTALTRLDNQLLEMPQVAWGALLADPQWEPLAYPLEERRRRARERMGPDREALVNDLSVDGYHAWGELYNIVVGRITIPFEQNGETVRLSVGQAENTLSGPDRSVRVALSAKWEEAWADSAELCSATLNHLAGYRLNLYKHRGWESVLHEPLENNRMTAKTLEVMWNVIERNKQLLVDYLNRKAKVMGIPKLGWHDVRAPLGKAGQRVSYQEATEFITEQFGRFSPAMAEFTRKAFAGRWIEAEDRPGKRPGGFCSNFPVSHQSRIFMTFSGTPSNVSTLAHELGHAYHQHVMNDLPTWAQQYAMNVAETASTFAEMLVSDAALRQAISHDERIALLDEKLERAVAFFMNIHARFQFEVNFYEERRHGPVSIERLNDLMVTAQKSAFHDALAGYHPHFWASKLHFYSTGQPFYNFPYSFGYLFSSGVYARAMDEGPGFAAKYVNLLRDTGRMTVEDLARRHLGVDLTQPDFWQGAVDQTNKDATEFLRITQ